MWGTHQDIADKIGVHRVVVTKWFSKGEIPLPRQAQYQIISRGRLRAELPEPVVREKKKPPSWAEAKARKDQDSKKTCGSSFMWDDDQTV